MLVPIIVQGTGSEIETNLEFYPDEGQQVFIPRIGDEIIYKKNGFNYLSVVVAVRWLFDSPAGPTAVLYIERPRYLG
jgi:hypothetical protein